MAKIPKPNSMSKFGGVRNSSIVTQYGSNARAYTNMMEEIRRHLTQSVTRTTGKKPYHKGTDSKTFQPRTSMSGFGSSPANDYAMRTTIGMRSPTIPKKELLAMMRRRKGIRDPHTIIRRNK